METDSPSAVFPSLNICNQQGAQWFEDSRTGLALMLGEQELEEGRDAYLYGYNFKRQFEYAIKEDPDRSLLPDGMNGLHSFDSLQW